MCHYTVLRSRSDRSPEVSSHDDNRKNLHEWSQPGLALACKSSTASTGSHDRTDGRWLLDPAGGFARIIHGSVAQGVLRESPGATRCLPDSPPGLTPSRAGLGVRAGFERNSAVEKVIRTFDTDICSYILRQRPAAVLQRFARVRPDRIWLSVIVAAELRYGAQRLASPKFAAAIEAWLAGFAIRPWTEEASRQYARIRHDLEQRGQPIGNMDLLIAAHALAEDSVLVTRNLREFSRVSGLAVEDWALSEDL